MQENTYESIDYPVPFNKLVSDHTKNLPFQVDISESLYGVVGDGSLLQGERLCLHFLKLTDALIAESGYEMYYVPVCSSYQCNIGVCKDKPLAPTNFSSMVRFLSSSALPKVVCVEDGAEPVKTGELLLVKELNHSHKNNKVNFITCWSITEQKEKCLKKSCKASFNVAPEATKVYLRDVIDHCQLPMTVKLHTTDTSTTTLTITERLLVKSVIASKQNNPNELLEILASTAMMAKKLETSASSSKELQKHTALVYEAFHPSQIGMIIATGSANYTPARTSICTSVLDDWRNNIQVVPPRIQSVLPENNSPKPCISIATTISNNIYENTSFQWSKKAKTFPCSVDTIACDNQQSQNVTTSHMHDDTSDTKPAVHDDAHPQFSMAASNCMKTSGPNHCETISNENISTDAPANLSLTHSTKSSNVNVSNKVTRLRKYEGNFNIISKFTPDQVLDLLDALNLSQYKEAFKREQVNGDLFLELDREILHEDLGVTSQLHQIRIMQIIEGIRPVPLRNN